MNARTDIKIRLLRGPEIAMGPGKADLLEAIRTTGSISAAARAMNMSYRRAWLLVEVMNHSFQAPLVASAVGGQKGGGAQLTEMGLEVLNRFRAVQQTAQAAVEAQMDALAALARAE